MKTRRDALSAASAVFASFVAFFTGGGITFLFFQQGDTGRLGVLVSVLPYLAGWLCAVGVLKLSSRLLPDSSAEEEGLPTHFPVKEDVLASVLALAVLLAANFAAAFLSGESVSGEVTLAAVLTGVFLKPYCEETLFRYGMLSLLIRCGKLSRAVSVTVSALTFALIHPIESMPFAAFAGAVLGILATRHSGKAGLRRGVSCTFAVHAAYNLILYLVLYLVSL